jgi:hypothetical protein
MIRPFPKVALLAGLLCVAAHAANETKPEPPAPKAAAKAAPKADGGKTAAAKKKEKEEHHCKLRLMWWLAPKEGLELGIQQENEVVPIGISQMQVNGVIDYHGEFAVPIVRKGSTGEVDKKGKPITSWLPYATLPLKPDDSDICVILFDNGKGGAAFRIFDFRTSAFPYGSLEVVNLSRANVACSLDGKVMSAAPGKAITSHNSFAQRTAPQITMAVQENGGEERILFMSRMIMSDNARSLFFVIERPSETIDGRYEVTSIVDMNPNPAGVIRSPSENTDTPAPKSPNAKGDAKTPKETKPAPKKAA